MSPFWYEVFKTAWILSAFVLLVLSVFGVLTVISVVIGWLKLAPKPSVPGPGPKVEPGKE